MSSTGTHNVVEISSGDEDKLPFSNKMDTVITVEEAVTSTVRTNTIHVTVPETPPPRDLASTTITIQIDRSEVQSPGAPSKRARRVGLRSRARSQPKEDLSEFSERYVEFMELCARMDGTDDMRRVLEQKVKPYYRRAEVGFVRSCEFEDLLTGALRGLRGEPAKMWVYVKCVVDALRSHRQSSAAGTEGVVPEREWADPAQALEARTLEAKLQRLQRKADLLDQEEVDFEQESSSAYVRAEGVKAQLVRVHARLCALRGERAAGGRRLRLARRAGRAAGPAARLEAWVNQGRAPRFPDFHDALQCVREADAADGLGWSEAQIMREARELFVACGRALQRLRQRRDWRLAAAHLPAGGGDPADRSAALQAELQDNRRRARENERLVFDKFENMETIMKFAPKKAKRNESEGIPQTPDHGSKSQDTGAEAAPVDSIEVESNDEKRKEHTVKPATEEKVKRKYPTGRGLPDESQNTLSKQESKSRPNSEDCQIISSDDEDSSSDGSSDGDSDGSDVVITGEVVDLGDSDVERRSVSDSDAGSDVDALQLLRRVQSRGAYRTRVYDVAGDSAVAAALSDSSEDSACVLVRSGDERALSPAL